MKPKHTPGPWIVNSETGIDVLTADNKSCIVVQNDSMLNYGHNLEANARLIASCPELLEALEAVGQELDDQGALDSLSDEVRDLMSRALNKATGGAR